MTTPPSEALVSRSAPGGPVRPAAGPRRVVARAGEPFTFDVDGEDVLAFPGESIAAAMLASGIDRFRTDASGQPRAPFCHMGMCFECVVVVDGERLRSCLAPATPDAEVRRTDER